MHDIDRNLSIYLCIFCRDKNLRLKTPVEIMCAGCGVIFPFYKGVMDSLIKPDHETIRELQGMAREIGFPIEKWESVKLRTIKKRSTLEDRQQMTARDPNSYYHQTLECFEQAFQIIKDRPLKRVLEVGADDDFCYLEKFKALGAHCFAANLRFDLLPDEAKIQWPESTLADMNHLPYSDSSMDAVLLSATSHHSPNLEKTIKEVARVIKPGGVGLFLNDQISGLFKRVNGAKQDHRNNYIHENYYSIGHYHRTFFKNGLQPQYLFSAYYDRKLKEANVDSLRFSLIGRLMKKPWQNKHFRQLAKKHLLWPAHFLFGFPLNVILWKK